MSNKIMPLMVFLVAGAAQAESVCVAVDAGDGLSAAEQSAVKALTEASFQQAGWQVGPTPCAAQYTIRNVRLGDAVVAHIRGPKGSARRKAASVDELDATYDQLVRAIVFGESNAKTRKNVTTAQAAPKRVGGEGTFFIAMGTGYTIGSGGDGLPTGIGYGYRYELDTVGVEIAGRGLSHGDAGMFDIRLAAMYFSDGTASASPYIGGGVGYGYLETADGNGGGLNLQGSVGYAFLRHSTIRMFVQADLTLPLFATDGQGEYEYDMATGEVTKLDANDSWSPTATVSLGLGF